MNTETSEIESDPPQIEPEDTSTDEVRVNRSEVPESKPRRGGGVLSFFAFLFSLAALAGAAWIWWQDDAAERNEEQRFFTEISRLENSDNELTLKLDQVRTQIESLESGDSTAEFAALQKRLDSDRSKVSSIEQAITEQLRLSRSLQAAAESMQGRLTAAEAALTGMSTRELDAGGELDLAEVDYLLRLANERLKLFSDPVAAGQALEVADMHLAALDNPMYFGVRQDIAAARRELASVQLPDFLEIANRLDSIQAEIATLPFSEAGPAAQSQQAPEAVGWWQKVKRVFSSLVTVRHSSEQENRRISLQDKDYIRQRVWLQLEIAHLSLMQRDQEAFRASLQRVNESLSEWFDTGDSAYQAVRKDVDSLLALDVEADVPDITAPWSALRLIRASQPRPAPAPVAEPGPVAQPGPEPEPEPDSLKTPETEPEKE